MFILHPVYTALDSKSNTDVIYLDFRKAFDKVPQQELLLKRCWNGITSPLWGWFKEYPLNKLHYVEVGGVASRFLNCNIQEGKHPWPTSLPRVYKLST